MKAYKLTKKTLLVKIIVIFLCVLIPAYACITLCFYKINGIIRENIFESTHNQVTQDLSSIQNMLQQISLLQQEYINDLDLYSIALGNQFFSREDISKTITRLQTRLSSISSFPFLADETFVYIYSLKMLVSATVKKNMEVPFETKSFTDDPTVQKPRLVQSNGQLYLLTVYPGVITNANPFFLIYTRINLHQLTKYLNSLLYPESAKLMLLDDQKQLIAAANLGDSEESQQSLSLIQYIDANNSSCLLKQQMFIVSDWTSKPKLALVAIYAESVAMLEFNRMRNMMILVLAAVCLLAMMFSVSIYKMVYKPLSVLNHAFKDVEAGNDAVHITYHANDEFRDIYDQFNKMVGRLHELIRRVYEQEIENKRSELKQLQSQINPHFLYNCFFTIYRLIKLEDLDVLSEFSHHMGAYYQYVTRSKKDVAMLSEEVKYAMDYVEIQNIRFSNRIDVDFKPLPAQYNDTQVPRFILQPILENCYEHGFSGSVATGIIEVRYHQEGNILQIQVSNSGSSISQEKCDELTAIMRMDANSAESTGIINVSRRLKLMYQRPDLLCIQPTSDNGVLVTLNIPLQENGSTAAS